MPRITVTTPEGHKQRYELSLDMDTVTIGRDSTCEIVIPDASVSGFHAEMRRIPGGFCIVDCESTSGVVINGIPSEWAELTNGMNIELGSSRLNLLFTDPELNQLIEEKKADGREEAIAVLKKAAEEKSQATKAVPPAPSPTPEVEASHIAATDPAPVTPPPAYDSPTAQYPAPAAAPAPVARPAAARPPGPGAGGYIPRPGAYSPGKSSEGHGLFVFMLLLICALAIIAGMTLRHYEETGRLLFHDIFTPAPQEEVVEEVEPPSVEPPREVTPEPVVQDEPEPPKPEPRPAPRKELMDSAIKNDGRDKLPSLDEFVIP